VVKNSRGFTFVVFQKSPKPFTTLNRAFTFCILADHRKEESVALPLTIPLVMIMLYVLMEGVTQRRFPKENQS
jgi:hypothetical protein